MSRPTRYERERALDAAMCLFWRKGYHATSLKDLEAALDMKPGSIYAAFASKENLCLLSLERYFEASLSRFRAHMETTASPLSGLADHLRGFARLAPEDQARQVCMLTRTLIDTKATTPTISACTRAYLGAIRDAFAAGFERAKAQGELPQSADSARLARRLQATVSALRFELHLGTDPAEVSALAEDMAREIEALRLTGA
ncbi:TetR/AcrR family transcriptional regulator (plasmid) [Paroceanicella profunda]|uniref:TetR/AcrR family transcriptional regulator n=1 Tax=Paroceanicella profunda TaxID=2579971 RepID=A0A5B8G3F6_9RHOB|nr:TetR/AcrR family transcriptional regulator [Paroceanicella profunda]QDL93899.1 TetR/AcrR family transcriptional regulator [Paroceanicella profunda]